MLTTQTVGSANKIKSKINLVKVDSMQLGGLLFKDVAALQINLNNSTTIKCTINGALVGASIIKKYIWQIDYPNRKIIVTDQLSRVALPANTIRIPVTFNNRLMPFINARVDGQDEKFMFDMGCSTLLSLTEKGAQKYLTGRKIIHIKGAKTEGGNGALAADVHVINIDSLQIGAVKFEHVPAYFSPPNNEMLIGSEIIKHFIVTMNFNNHELYLTPIAKTVIDADWQTFGFGMEYKDGKVMVSVIYSGLAADRAGIRQGDEIIQADGEPLHFNDYCDCMHETKTLLQHKQKLALTILQDGKQKEIVLTKEKGF